MSWYKALFSFNGRLNRRGFWIGFGIHFLFLFMVAMWINLAELSLLSVLPLIITGFSLSAIIIKRLHDRNRFGKSPVNGISADYLLSCSSLFTRNYADIAWTGDAGIYWNVALFRMGCICR